MKLNLLDILRCPFCGSTLTLEEGDSLERCGDEVESGIIFCQCSAYPVVASIPILTADYLADEARQHLAEGRREEALFTMLGLTEETRQAAFRSFIEKGGEASYQEGVEVLCPDAEGTYFIYRFSDPTFVVGSTLLDEMGD